MLNDNFKFVIPADLEKGSDGEWRIRGLASTEHSDLQGETIIQKGIDLTPIEKKKGVLNFDHQRGPENTIGLLDGYTRTDQGLMVEGRLFKNHTKAKAVYEIMSSLSKGDRGRVGLSVEGKILQRNSSNPSIIEKCQINAVAVTLSPVNQNTYADLVKSMISGEVEFNSEEQIGEQSSEGAEPTFTATQVLSIVKKALGIGSGAIASPDSRSGGDALAVEDLDDKKKDKKPKVQGATEQYRPIKKMAKAMYKSNLILILDKLQELYPTFSRSEIWEAVKDRLDTKFEKAGIRIRNISGKEREHKLYEDARQREDYERNKDKSRAELHEIAEQSGASKHDKAKIRAQRDAAIQVGDRDHVRPHIKG